MSLSLSLTVNGASGSEMDAVEALLNLRFSHDSPPSDGVQGPSSLNQRQILTANRSMKGVALAGAKIEADSKAGGTIINLENGNGFIIRRGHGAAGVSRPYRHLKPPKKRSSYRKDEENKKIWTSTPILEKDIENGLRDIGTQTEGDNPLPVIQKMEDTISELCLKLKHLQETQVKTQRNGGTLTNSSRRKTRSTDSADSIMKFEPYSPSDDDNDSEYRAESEEKDSLDDDISEDEVPEVTHSFRNGGNVIGDDMVPIGNGHALVPARLLRQMAWSPSTYTAATRKLLTAVFSRRILATHSLSGKRSPAFPDKPAKNRLTPALVNDIIQTVCERCNVPENLVRVSITTKCADESKMLRTRENNKKKKSTKKENIPPKNRRSTSSSTGSSASHRIIY